MGQISLPRLEKINVSMKWESGLLLQHHHWLNPKISLLNYYLSSGLFFFKKHIFSKNLKKQKNFFFLKEESFNKKISIKTYSYQQRNIFKSLLVYSNVTRDIFYLKKYKFWYIKEKTVKYSEKF